MLYGDSADEDMLVSAGCDHASAVVVSFSSPGVALAIVRTVRRLRADVPILVRTVDDAHAPDLMAAGATQIIPETFEMGLNLVGAALRALGVPVPRVVQALGQVRDTRYALLRDVRPHTDSPMPAELAGAARGAAHRGHSAGRLGGGPLGGGSPRRAAPRWPSRESADTGYWAMRRRAARACGRATWC